MLGAVSSLIAKQHSTSSWRLRISSTEWVTYEARPSVPESTRLSDVGQRMKSLAGLRLGVSYGRVIPVTIFVLLASLACGSTEEEPPQTGLVATVRPAPDASAVAAAGPTSAPTPEVKGATAMESSDSTPVHPTLPQRSGPPPRTTGSVPHTQIDVDPVPEVHDELFRRTFALPDVENRPTIVSLPGARGVWISDGVSLARIHRRTPMDGVRTAEGGG